MDDTCFFTQHQQGLRIYVFKNNREIIPPLQVSSSAIVEELKAKSLLTFPLQRESKSIILTILYITV